jgi:hypothetical protein
VYLIPTVPLANQLWQRKKLSTQSKLQQLLATSFLQNKLSHLFHVRDMKGSASMWGPVVVNVLKFTTRKEKQPNCNALRSAGKLQSHKTFPKRGTQKKI